jgi:outer membrane protein OmpA-like peptidoglycan-associated protein
MKVRQLLFTCALGASLTVTAQTTPDSTVAQPVTTAPDSTAVSAPSPSAPPDSSAATIVPPASGDSTLLASAAPSATTRKEGEKATAKALQWANTLYNQKAYAEAIPYYEKARQGDSEDKAIIMKLGDCYRLTNNVTGKLHCYGELVRSGHALPEHYLYYGQALQENGEMDKAKEFFDRYTADVRGSNLALSAVKAQSYTKNADAYSVTPANFNSDKNDYCAVKFFDATVFNTSRTKTSWVRTMQGWTNGEFMNLYAVQKDGEVAQPFMGDLNSKFNDGPVSFTKDFNTVYFTRNNTGKAEKAKDGTYKLKILEANLDQNGFSMVKLMPFGNKDFNFAHPSISPDGLHLYFASDMEGGRGGMDIYMTIKDSSANWGTPVNMGPKVNTPGNEVFPYIAPNDVLYFSSNGHDGLGALDIYETKRTGGEVTRVYNMGEPINSRADDFGYYLTEDLKNGFLSSNRKAGGMDDDIYDLVVLREVKRGKEATLITKDKATGLPVDSVKLVINGDTVVTNEKGEYVASPEEETEYKIEAFKNDYFKAEDVLSAKLSTEDSFTKDILIEKDPKLFLRALITDAKTGELLEGATIRLTDLATNSEVDLYTTTASGDYFKFLFGNRIGDKLAYLVKVEKPGYLQRTAVFTHEITKPGEVNMNESVNLSLGKVEVGMDLAKMIDLKPIYFDMGKATIRQDAALELDKIVQVMNEYPNMIIELGSHTDCRSSAASNLKLSTNRAKASANYIIKKGINKLRITGKGYGETKLLNNCICEGQMQSSCPEEDHAKNRRTEFIITKLK